MLLTDGDVTKVPVALTWTPKDAGRYLERMAERRSVDRALLGFMGIKPPELHDAPRTDGKVGGYCEGKCVAACETLFGDGLWLACRTCPN